MVKKVQIVAFAIIVIAVTAFNVKTVVGSNHSYDLNTVTLAAMVGDGGEQAGEDDPIDGGEVGGGGITCNTGGSGTCYKKKFEVREGKCRCGCKPTGDIDDYCSAFWMGVLDTCINIMI